MCFTPSTAASQESRIRFFDFVSSDCMKICWWYSACYRSQVRCLRSSFRINVRTRGRIISNETAGIECSKLAVRIFHAQVNSYWDYDEKLWRTFSLMVLVPFVFFVFLLLSMYVYSYFLSMYSYCCLCILIVRPCILIVVYVFVLLSMYFYCTSMYSYCCLCIRIVVYVFSFFVHVFLLLSMYS